MLHIINSLSDLLIEYIKDDPVRPEIPAEFRVSNTTEIIALMIEGKPAAIVCVAYRDVVPRDCIELMCSPINPTVAVFYTIWSYQPRAGRTLIQEVRADLTNRKPDITKFVTLSPHTEMARKFHSGNGASVFRSNDTSVNYEYA